MDHFQLCQIYLLVQPASLQMFYHCLVGKSTTFSRCSSPDRLKQADQTNIQFLLLWLIGTKRATVHCLKPTHITEYSSHGPTFASRRHHYYHLCLNSDCKWKRSSARGGWTRSYSHCPSLTQNMDTVNEKHSVMTFYPPAASYIIKHKLTLDNKRADS